jgi:DNA uptake protein ComE-like DNA-binding protein
MKNRIFSIFLAVAALFLFAGLSCAADTKAPVAKQAVDSAKAASKAAPEAKGTAKKEPVDINSASDAELKAIPGLGAAYVAKIVVNRPYANKAQLKSRKIVPDTVYEKIKDLIIAKQPKKK